MLSDLHLRLHAKVLALTTLRVGLIIRSRGAQQAPLVDQRRRSTLLEHEISRAPFASGPRVRASIVSISSLWINALAPSVSLCLDVLSEGTGNHASGQLRH